MTETMLAERFHAADRSITLEDIPIPHPGPGEVLVKVAYCGICHSDLSLISGAFPAALPVVTQGHEASGTIVELGAGVIGWKEGDTASSHPPVALVSSVASAAAVPSRTVWI